RPRARAPRLAGARLVGRRAAPDRPVEARVERAPALRRRLRLALGRARACTEGERPRRRRPRRRTRLLPDARPRMAPRLLPRPGRDALRRRRGRRAHRAREVRAPTLSATGDRPRGMGTYARRDRAPRSRGAGTDPLRRLPRRRGPRRRVARHDPELVEARRERNGSGHVRGGGPFRRRRCGRRRGRPGLRPRRPLLAPLPRPRALLAKAPRGPRERVAYAALTTTSAS